MSDSENDQTLCTACLQLGSPQSKESNDRLEAKIDVILRKVDPEDGAGVIQELDERYAGRHTDKPEAHKA
jgi:hypothetical protein